MGGLQYVLVVNTRFIFVLGALLLSDGSQELGRGGGSQVEPPYIWGTVYIQSREMENGNTKFGRKCFICPAVKSLGLTNTVFKYI